MSLDSRFSSLNNITQVESLQISLYLMAQIWLAYIMDLIKVSYGWWRVIIFHDPLRQVSSAVLREDIVNLCDFIERLKIEEDQTVLDWELTFLLACLQLCDYISVGSNTETSCISYEIMHHSESSATMTEDQLVELLDALLVNLHYLPKVRAELLFPSMTQYELLQNDFGNLRDFHGLTVNGCIEHKAIEYVLPQFQLMAERVGHFCFALLAYQLDKTDETDEDEDEKDETDEDDEKDEKDEEDEGGADEDGLDHILEVSQVNSMLVHLLLKIIPVSLEVMHICSTILEASKSAELGCF
ncbi:hypothetical protein BC332_14244, partial [Capsicum chinense]